MSLRRFGDRFWHRRADAIESMHRKRLTLESMRASIVLPPISELRAVLDAEVLQATRERLRKHIDMQVLGAYR